MEKFKFLKHTADIKFRAFGKNAEEVFGNSFLALKHVIYGGKIKKKKKIKIKAKGKDFESLLYNFLEEFLFLFDSRNFLFSEIKKLKIKEFQIEAEVFGDDAKNYKINQHVKAVTYNEMFVKKQGKKWIAQVVVDV
jgi:SHS2 domain-containing protein